MKSKEFKATIHFVENAPPIPKEVTKVIGKIFLEAMGRYYEQHPDEYKRIKKSSKKLKN